MRKELVWAGIIGISFGLIIAFGAWRINSSLKPKSPITKQTPPPQNIGDSKITLDKPENNDVVIANSVTVSGITKSLSWLTVSGENGDYIIQSDEQGIFSQDVDLVGGVNQIKVTSFDPAGNQVSQKVLVVYSSSFQLNTVASPAPENATGDADIKQKVAQKVAAALSHPKAYIGTVTDIADSTIQIKTMESAIEQIAVGGTGITVVNTKGTNNKTVKLTDIAIGDFIVAMGYINQKSVLDAQRILIDDTVTEPEITISMAKVSDVSKKILNGVVIKDGKTASLTPDKNTDILSFMKGKTKSIKLTDISPNDLIIFVTDTSGTSPKVRSIFDVATPQS